MDSKHIPWLWLVIGLPLCIFFTIWVWRHYERDMAAFEAGYEEIQNVGASGTHWRKIDASGQE